MHGLIDNSVNLGGKQTITGLKTFSRGGRSISDQNNKALLTTVSHNAAQNGYFKLGNGLIVQWGYTTGTTITLPIPFTSATSYGVSLTAVRTGAGGSWYGCVNTIASTSFKYLQDSSKSPAYWVAIGY